MPSQRGHRTLRLHVREGQENDVRRFRKLVAVEFPEREIAETAQVRIDAIQPLTGEPFRRYCRHVHLGMDGEQTEELRSHVPTSGRDRNFEHRVYRFEYWNLDRAPGWPYFLRSFMRGSR